MDKNKDNGFGFGTIAAWGANIGAFLTTNWIMAMSAAFGLLTAIWKWLTDLVAIPSVELAIFVFLAVLWTSIGITVLSDRRKARLVRTEPEYKYSLTFEGIVPKYNNTHPAAALQFGILFRNYSLGPIK